MKYFKDTVPSWPLIMMLKTMTVTLTTTSMRTITTKTTTLQCERNEMFEMKTGIKTNEDIANVSFDYAK